MIDPAKTYRTRDGREVRIYAVDGGKSDPVHGAVKATDGDWIHQSWNESGQYSGDGLDDRDLIEVKKKHVRWVNVYEGDFMSGSYHTQQEANEFAARRPRLACIRIEFEEGEGL